MGKSLHTTGNKGIYHDFCSGLCFDIGLPVLSSIALFFPLNYMVFKDPYMYEKVFSSSDLILLSTLFIISIASEINRETRFNGVESNLELVYYPLLTSAFLMLLMYGFCKYKYISYSFPTTGDVSDTIKSISLFSLSVLTASTLTVIAFKYHLMGKKLDQGKTIS